MVKESFIIKPVDDFYILWVENGNQYIKLEEPAYFVLTNYISGLDINSIAKDCSSKYKNRLSECKKFVSEIISGFESYRKYTTKTDNFDIPGLGHFSFAPFSKHYYSIKGKSVCFHFQTRDYESFVHPFLKHLENGSESEENEIFEIFNYNGDLVLRVDNQVKGVWKENETHLLKGMTSMNILNAAYEKEESDWMAVIHASAVTDGKMAIIFTAGPGSGKSTIAALLNQKGYDIISDDFVPIDSKDKFVFQYPAALSVKEGSVDVLSQYYSGLKDENGQFKSLTNKRVRYLPISDSVYSVKVRAIVFIKYDLSTELLFERISKKEALPLLMEETWTYPSAENAERFIAWFNQIDFFVLRYSDNDKALNAIKDLFE